MPLIEITYHAEVTVVVDLDTETVDSVTVYDEGAEYDPQVPAHVRPLYERHPTPDEVRRAVHIAQHAEEWPAWELGS